MSKSDNLYQFSAECFVDISKVINNWPNGLFRVISVNQDKNSSDYIVIARIDNTDLVQIRKFLKGIEEDMDTYTVTETIVKI